MGGSSSSPKLKAVLLLSSLIFFAAYVLGSPVSSWAQDLVQPNLVSSLESAIDIVQQAIGVISNLAGGLLGDSRLTNAITDCVDLLDFSADVLRWSVAAAQNHTNEEYYGTGDVNFDQRTWLSAVLSNHETCLDGFDGTNGGLVKTIVAASLDRVTLLVEQLLAQLNHNPSPEPASPSSSTRGAGFPSWVVGRDRKVLLRKGVKLVDVVVAHDGSGNFSKVQDAVNAAPDHSRRRFVIHIKAGVYHEYMEINKTKLNIMLVGDGIGATVISGNRNRHDGWTTFRSATLGNIIFFFISYN